MSAQRDNVPVDFRENQSFRYRYFGGVKPESKLASGLVAGEVVRNAEGLAKAQCNTVLATLTPNNARNRVEGYYAGPKTKLGISVIAVWHITDHYGQLVEYLR